MIAVAPGMTVGHDSGCSVHRGRDLGCRVVADLAPFSIALEADGLRSESTPAQQ